MDGAAATRLYEILSEAPPLECVVLDEFCYENGLSARHVLKSSDRTKLDVPKGHVAENLVVFHSSIVLFPVTRF